MLVWYSECTSFSLFCFCPALVTSLTAGTEPLDMDPWQFLLSLKETHWPLFIHGFAATVLVTSAPSWSEYTLWKSSSVSTHYTLCVVVMKSLVTRLLLPGAQVVPSSCVLMPCSSSAIMLPAQLRWNCCACVHVTTTYCSFPSIRVGTGRPGRPRGSGVGTGRP